MWSTSDWKFMYSLRIVADEPPSALLRFFVEPGAIEGEFHLVDRLRKFHVAFIFGIDWKEQAKAAAEEYAKQLNNEHQKAMGDTQ